MFSCVIDAIQLAVTPTNPIGQTKRTKTSPTRELIKLYWPPSSPIDVVLQLELEPIDLVFGSQTSRCSPGDRRVATDERELSLVWSWRVKIKAEQRTDNKSKRNLSDCRRRRRRRCRCWATVQVSSSLADFYSQLSPFTSRGSKRQVTWPPLQVKLTNFSSLGLNFRQRSHSSRRRRRLVHFSGRPVEFELQTWPLTERVERTGRLTVARAHLLPVGQPNSQTGELCLAVRLAHDLN